MRRRHCSVCHLPGHTATAHRATRPKPRRPKRGNIEQAYWDKTGFHPIRAAKDYDFQRGGDFKQIEDAPGKLAGPAKHSRKTLKQREREYTKRYGKPGSEQRERKLDYALRKAEFLQELHERSVEDRQRQLQQIDGSIDGLKSYLDGAPTEYLWLVRKSGRNRGGIADISVAEWNRHFRGHKAHSGMLNKAGYVEPVYGLDAVASEHGYSDPQDLMTEIIRAKQAKDEIRALEHKRRNLKEELKAPKRKKRKSRKAK